MRGKRAKELRRLAYRKVEELGLHDPENRTHVMKPFVEGTQKVVSAVFGREMFVPKEGSDEKYPKIVKRIVYGGRLSQVYTMGVQRVYRIYKHIWNTERRIAHDSEIYSCFR